MTSASGIGSWPGTAAREAVRTIRDLLGDGVPYLPELPARGVGADMIGRTASLLEGLHVETQPYGWRFVDRPGRDEGRAAAYLREDLDELAEAYDGWTGPLKLQLCGPLTLAATVELTRGERAVADHGARRDIASALAEGVTRHLADVARLVPAADLVLQVDEPALPAVLEGQLPTASGYGRLRRVDRAEVREGLRTVLDASGPRRTVLHSCAADTPVTLVREAGADGLALDLATTSRAQWDELAEAVESGMSLWAGAVPTTGPLPTWQSVRDRVLDPWHKVGLGADRLAQVIVTPACGLAGDAPSSAVSRQRVAGDVAQALTER